MTTLIIDTETTSKLDDREPIEIAYVALEQVVDMLGQSTDAIAPGLPFCWIENKRFKPTKPITFGAMAVHHILPRELEDCPPPSSFTLPDGVEFLVGHSIDFDWHAIGRPDVKRICTHAMAEHCWPEADSHSLAALLYMLDGPTPETRHRLQNAHSALTDALNCRLLLKHILAEKPEITTWSALYAFSEEARIPIYMPMKKWEGVKLVNMEDSAISWCLRQDWLDSYLRKGLERVLEQRHGAEENEEDREEEDSEW